MRLAKLVLSGFKSFADHTEFRFDAPITGIVGPNGCGKSNVVDAIKWVLGERSAKSLRGGAMLDVIFAGSAARKPAGMASVTLCFENPLLAQAIERSGDDTPLLDNEVDPETGEPIERIVDRQSVRNRRLPIDTDLVEVTRRLTSDGKSDYLINARKVRLKDIRDLFLDTGIGNDAYSIIEQGKVDAMLLANPVERRAILEEAAGVARFRVRKIEATRKLESAEKNLVATREQLANTERRLRIVRGQADKARRFQELDARKRFLRRELSLDLFHELEGRLHGLTSELQVLEGEKAALSAALSAAEDAKQDAEIVRGLQRVRRLTDHIGGDERMQRFLARERRRQRLAVDELHREVHQPFVGFAEVEDAGHIRVRDLAGVLGLAREALQGLRFVHKRRSHDLDGTLALHAHVLGQKHLTHAALTELLDHLVSATDHLADQVGFRLRHERGAVF
jgi:chromosome segregation protein